MPLDTAFSPAWSSPPNVTGVTFVAARANVTLEFVHPLTRDVTEVHGPEGSTITELLAAAGVTPRRWGAGYCYVEDAARTAEPTFIDRRHWHRVRPKAGTITTVSLWPSGGGGGGGGKGILRIVLSIAVIILAAVGGYLLGPLVGPLLGGWFATTAGTAALGAAFTGVISVVGNLIINALIPPPKPRTAEERLTGLAQDRAGFFLQGTSNRARPYQPIPLHLGRLRRFADVGAEFFSEIVGNDQYLRFFLVWGLGPLKVTELKIGETPLAEFEGVETRTVEGWPDDGPPQIFANDPHTDGLSIELKFVSGWQTRTTIDNTDEIQVEIAFPNGLWLVLGNDPNGSLLAYTVTFAAEIAPDGTENWAPVTWSNSAEQGFGTPGAITITDRTRTGQPRRVGRIKPGNGKWRVRLKRTLGDNSPADSVMSLSFWSALKSIKYTLPIGQHLVGKLAYTEGRIKATGQLNGVVQELNAVVESYVRLFDASGYLGSWAVPRTNWIVSRNPAELLAHVLGHWSALKPVPATRDNWLNLVEWRDAAAAVWTHGAPRWRYDRVFENATTLGAIADEIASVGRARRGMVAGKHGVVRDVAQSTVKQHFTPRNSWDFNTDIVFRRRLHALRIRFNKDGLGQEAEITVYDDGYDALTATEIETAEFIGVTFDKQAWCEGRYHLAVQKLRPHTYALNCDPEHRKAGRGALVRATHDVVGWGTASGRIRSRVTDGGGNFLSVTLDTKVTMEAGKSYGIRIRNPEGSFAVTVVTVPGEQSQLTFTTPQPPSWAINAVDGDQDLFGFGEAGADSAELIVKGVAPSANLNARMTLVDAAPSVHTADTGTIPEFDPQITLPPADARKPDPPSIRDIRSDESVLEQRVGGALVVRFVAEFNPPSGQPVPEYIQARWRPIEASPWTPGPLQPSAGLVYSGVGVEQGVAYRIEFRHVTAAGAPSDWVGRDHTIVGKTTPPPDIPSVAVGGEHVVWPYPNAPLDVTHGGGFALRFHYGDDPALADLWGSAAAAHDGLLSDTRFPVALLPPGTLTILVKAVDADGNESASPALLVKDIGGPPLANVIESFDFKAAGWPGAISGGAIVAGDIEAQTGTLMWSGNPASPMWNANPATLLWATTYPQLVYETQLVPPAAALPARLTFAHEHAGVPFAISYRKNTTPLWTGNPAAPLWSATPASTPLWSPPGTIAWPGALDLEDAHPIDIRLEGGGGPSQGKFQALAAEFDVPDLDEGHDDVALAAGGTRLVLVNDYRAIKTVIATLQDDGGAARSLKVIDKDPDLGPLLRAFDAAGAGTTATIDARVQGY